MGLLGTTFLIFHFKCRILDHKLNHPKFKQNPIHGC